MRVEYTKHTSTFVKEELTDFIDGSIADSDGDYCVFEIAGLLARLVDLLAENGALSKDDLVRLTDVTIKGALVIKGDSDE